MGCLPKRGSWISRTQPHLIVIAYPCDIFLSTPEPCSLAAMLMPPGQGAVNPMVDIPPWSQNCLDFSTEGTVLCRPGEIRMCGHWSLARQDSYECLSLVLPPPGLLFEICSDWYDQKTNRNRRMKVLCVGEMAFGVSDFGSQICIWFPAMYLLARWPWGCHFSFLRLILLVQKCSSKQSDCMNLR